MTTTTNVKQLKLNIMTQQQYSVAEKNASELYVVTDADVLPSQSGKSGKFLTTNGTTASWGDVPTELPSQTSQSGKFLTTNGTTVSWANVDALPSQTSQSGKFLTTNGTTASWANIPTEIPTQTGNSGKFLTTNGSAVSWATVDALPSQSSQSGKFLTTNGTTASWADVPTEIPTQTGNSGKYLTTNGTTVSWATVDALPSQTSQSGKFLTTNGTTASWGTPTDTKNTAGSTDTSSKIYLIGSTAQSANSQTYSHDTAFVDTSGQLNSSNPAASENSTVVATTKWVIDKGYTTNTGTITGITMNGSSKGTSGVVDLGTVLTSHQTIKQDGITGATVNRYGSCSTSASTAQKDVSITAGSFSLEAGAKVTVKFTNANTASNPTLKVGSTAAKNIFHKGSQITTGDNKALLAGVCDFVYDGTQYHLVGNYISESTSYTGGTNINISGNTISTTATKVTIRRYT